MGVAMIAGRAFNLPSLYAFKQLKPVNVVFDKRVPNAADVQEWRTEDPGCCTGMHLELKES